MTPTETKKAAKSFVERWKAMPCIEEEHSRSFWIELLGDVLGVKNPTRVLDFERKVRGRKIDVFYEDMGVLIEQKSRNVSLDKTSERSKKAGEETPYQQAKWYADNLPLSLKPRWIITCNFDEFRIYDQEKIDNEHHVSFTLDELPEQYHLLTFFTDKENSRIEREKELSVKAGERVGKLYNAFAEQYKNIETNKHEQRSLNVLMVRLIFLLYAEDSGVLNKDALLNYLKPFKVEQMRKALIELFEVLDTPEDERDEYLEKDLAVFPYVNGGLFGNDDIVVPQFNDNIRYILLTYASGTFDWKDISPTIFGAVFESTLNPQTRRSGGMHYTSIENIHKVIDPLFLDDLRAELSSIEGIATEKTRVQKLYQFQDKLASITCFDPAAGSGNFLTESYLSLRSLENRVLENLHGDQRLLGFKGDASPIKVSIDQFFGIEINDFAVSVAKTALWIAEEQMLEKTKEIVDTDDFSFLPLTSNNNIHKGNALRMSWEEVLPASECSYIIGNPPFIGYSNHSKEQGEDRALLFGKVKTVDYVACWYKKAALYMRANKNIHAAFVSTNSICQGQQVQPIWQPLFEDGIHINFAYKSFIWNNEASEQAHVHVIIIGFSYEHPKACALFEGDREQLVDNINGYLASAKNVFIERRKNPICNVEPMVRGSQPTDNGYLLLDQEEYEELIKKEPKTKQWIRPFSMGEEFIKSISRYCLWLVDITPAELKAMPEVMERVRAVRDYRLQSKKAATRKKAETPWRFDEVRPPKQNPYIGIPKVSSNRRQYIPIGFVGNNMIPGDKLYYCDSKSLYVFGILLSQFHNGWMRVVAGRLGMGYSYANTIVYNNFPWPGVTRENIEVPVEQSVAQETKEQIETYAQKVLDARKEYTDQAQAAGQKCSLADMYDPDNDFLYPKLTAAHKSLDKAVEAAYGVNFNGDEEKIVAHLFKLYEELTS